MDKILYILEDLKKHHRKKSDVLESVVQKRLDDSLSAYYDKLTRDAEFLERKDALKLAKQLNGRR